MMRYAFATVLLCTVLGFSARGVAAQSTSEDETPDAAQAIDPADVSQPEATPLVVFVVVTATPVPTVEATPTPVIYTTRKGPRSESDLKIELSSAGYQGPWDPPSMLAAYDRTTAPTATPVPTINPVLAQCQAVVNAMPAFLSAGPQFAKASARNDFLSIKAIAADLRSRTYPPLMLPTVNAFLTTMDWEEQAAEFRYEWPVLTAGATQSSNGYYLLSIAQIDLNHDEGEARAAEVDFETAARQLATACPGS